MKAVRAEYIVETRSEDELIFKPLEQLRGTIVDAMRHAAHRQLQYDTNDCVNEPACQVRLRKKLV
jgi:hypothetical protein